MDIRYSKVDPENSSSANYLNKILFPSVSPNSYTNSGFTTFEYDTVEKKATALKSTFLKVAETFDKSASTSADQLPFFRVDFTEKFSFNDFSGDEMAALVTRLSDDLPLAREYIFNKMGIDTSDEEQVKAGLIAYKYCELIGFSRTWKNAFLQEKDVHNTLCAMAHGKTSQELQSCIDQKADEYDVIL